MILYYLPQEANVFPDKTRRACPAPGRSQSGRLGYPVKSPGQAGCGRHGQEFRFACTLEVLDINIYRKFLIILLFN